MLALDLEKLRGTIIDHARGIEPERLDLSVEHEGSQVCVTYSGPLLGHQRRRICSVMRIYLPKAVGWRVVERPEG